MDALFNPSSSGMSSIIGFSEADVKVGLDSSLGFALPPKENNGFVTSFFGKPKDKVGFDSSFFSTTACSATFGAENLKPTDGSALALASSCTEVVGFVGIVNEGIGAAFEWTTSGAPSSSSFFSSFDSLKLLVLEDIWKFAAGSSCDSFVNRSFFAGSESSGLTRLEFASLHSSSSSLSLTVSSKLIPKVPVLFLLSIGKFLTSIFLASLKNCLLLLTFFPDLLACRLR